MKAKHRRLVAVVAGVTILGTAVILALFAVQNNIVFFRDPTAVLAGKVSPGQRFRLGGLVEMGSVKHVKGDTVDFKVTDLKNAIPVVYSGLLPDLFREGQGVVTEGHIGKDGVFHADTVLAKHDENYMPKNVVEALKKSGRWKEYADEALPNAR
ncbi:MAG TPA: cytochrome c maturation protein CcmE [Alphaproteobacteria bacterium]|nr:cytochrome c maturation protein CcmE [Alphaproteobacteria bacterium]